MNSRYIRITSDLPVLEEYRIYNVINNEGFKESDVRVDYVYIPNKELVWIKDTLTNNVFWMEEILYRMMSKYTKHSNLVGILVTTMPGSIKYIKLITYYD